MEKTNKCDHFTIRGYVADVRKQDAKICWPLSVPHNQTVEALASSLPPLIVPDFGRWYCGNCLNSRVTSEEAKGSTSVWTENAASRINDFPPVLKNGADNLLSSFQQPSKIIASGIDVAEVGTSSVIVDNNEVSPVICNDTKELQNLRKESTTTAEYNSFEADNNVRKDVTIYANNLDTGPRDTRSNKWVCVKRSDIDLNRAYEDGDISDGALTYDRIEILTSCNVDCDKINAGDKTKLLCDDATRESIVLLNGSCTQKDAAPCTTMSPSTNQVNLDQIKDKIFCSMDISDDLHHRNHERVASSSNGKFNYKKGRKIRLRSLEDIMRKDASYIPKDLCFSKGDAKLPKTKSVYDTPCRLNCEVKHSTNNLCQTSEPTIVKSSLVDSQAGENNDDETSLKHWLTSVSKKSIVEKRSFLTKQTEDTACGSVGKPSQKGVHHMKKISGEKPQQKVETEKENKRPRVQSGKPCHGSQQKNLISEAEPIKFVHSKNIQRMRTTIPEKNLDIDHGNMDKSCDEMCDSNKKPKRKLQVGDGSSSWMLSKKEMIKKQRTPSRSRKATLEDIPMDVVEILAKIQHERHLPTAKFSTDMPVPNDSYVARGCKSSSWDPVHTNLGNPNDMGRTIHVRDQNFQVGQATCGSSKHQKRNLHIDLNQQASDSYQTMPDFIGHNPFTVPFDYLKESHSCHYLPLDKVQMQPFGFCHEDLVPFAQDSRRTVPDTLALPRSDRIFGVNMRMSCPEQNFVNTVSHDGYLRGGLVTVVKKSEEARKSTDAYVMNAGWNAEQSTDRVSLPFETCCMEGQNRYHFGTMDLSGSCSNGTVSATNLLKLVNQAAFSGASLDRNSDACCNSPCTVIHGSEFGMRNKGVLSGSWGDAYSSEDQIYRGFSQPHRPVARIGIFGPLLQDEITTHTNKYGTTMGSEVSQADEPPYLQITGEKVECSYSSVHSKCRNMDDAVLVRKSVPTMSVGSSFVQGYSSSKYGRDQAVIARKGKAVHHARNSCATECCIINRNPADFTLPDDDNEYMREVKI